METTGRLKDVQRDWKSGQLIVSFQIDTTPPDLGDLMQMDKLSVKAVKHSGKRSLNANSYFHALVGKMAAVLQTSLTEVKNRMIREYGAYEFVDDQIPTFQIKAVYEDQMLRNESIHVKPIGRDYRDGCEWVRFAMMRGSHTYSTQEMARLIDGTVSEAKELGIETLPPHEIERMEKAWKKDTSGN